MVVASAGCTMVIWVGWACAREAPTVSDRATIQAKSGIGLPPLSGGNPGIRMPEGIAVGRAIL
jgi:hypothetical protein